MRSLIVTGWSNRTKNSQLHMWVPLNRSNSPDVFLGKGILKICGKFTGEHPCQSVISIKLQNNWENWENKTETTSKTGKIYPNDEKTSTANIQILPEMIALFDLTQLF